MQDWLTEDVILQGRTLYVMCRVGQNCIYIYIHTHTVYDRIVGDFSAKKYRMYISIYGAGQP